VEDHDLVDTSFLRPVDVQRLASELNVDARAAKRKQLAEVEQKSADSSFVLDASNMLNGKRQTAEQDVWKRLDTLQQLMLTQAARVSFAKCKNESEADLNDMRVLLRKHEGDLVERSAFYQQELNSFETYRFRRKLTGPAKSANPPLQAFMDLFAIWVLEGAMNMYFFQVGEKNAWLGAIILALLISLVNISVSLAVGYYITKLKNSISIPLKIIGVLGTAIYLPVLVAAQYAIAQYRAQEQLAGDAKHLLSATQYWTNTLHYIQQHPFQFSDIISLLLFFVSLGFGIYAWRKGYSYGDPYPFYTSRYEAYKKHRHSFEDLQNEILDELVDTRNLIVDRISEFIDDVGPSLVAMEQNATTSSVLVGHLHAFRESCDNAKALLLNRYYSSEGGAPAELLTRADDSSGQGSTQQRFHTLLESMRKSLIAAQEIASGATTEADRYRQLAIQEINSVIDRLDKLKATANAKPT